MEDDTGDEFVDTGRGQEHVSVLSSVFGSIFQVDGLELFEDGGGGFVSGEDAFAGGADFVCSLDEFLGVVVGLHVGLVKRYYKLVK